MNYDAGHNTSRGMWEMLSDELERNEIKIPVNLNEDINSLVDGGAKVAPPKLIDELYEWQKKYYG